MLLKLRDKSQGWLAWLIIGALAFTFLFFGAGSFFAPSRSDHTVVATVEGQKITLHDLDLLYERMLRQPGAESLRHLDPKTVKKDLLETLVEETVLLKSASQLGFAVSPQKINAILKGVDFFQEGGHFSEAAYQQFLSRAHYTDGAFRQLLHDGLLKQQIQQGIIQTLVPTSLEINKLADFALEKRDLRYLVVPRSSLEQGLNSSPEEITAYYQQHQADFMTPETLAVEYIYLSPAHLPGKTEPDTEEALEHKLASLAEELGTLAYDHPDSLEPAATQLGLKLQKSEPFTHQSGPKEQILQNTAVIAAAFSDSLKQDKNNSDLIKLDDKSYIVIRTADYSPSQLRPLAADNVKDSIEKSLLSEKSSALAKAKAQLIYEKAGLEKTTDKLLSDYEWVALNNAVRKTQENEADLVAAAFAMPRPKYVKGPVLRIVPRANGDYAVVWLTKVTEGDYESLGSDVKESYQSAIKESLGEIEYALYIRALSQRAKIKTHPEKV